MLALIVVSVAVACNGIEPLDVVRKHYGEPHLPGEARARVFPGTGLRFDLPPGEGVDPTRSSGLADGLPWVARSIAGDFEAVALVRLRLNPAAGAAGVTEIHVKKDGTTEHIAVPTLLGGFIVSGVGNNQLTA